MTDALLPEKSSGEIIPVDRLGAETVRSVMAQWRQLKGARRFPSLQDIETLLAGPHKRDLLVIRILEGGADYEYIITGAVHVDVAVGVDLTGFRVSQFIDAAAKFGLGLRMLYEMVRAGGEPLGYRGWRGRDMPHAKYVYHESALMPLGKGDTVDHILVASSLVMA